MILFLRRYFEKRYIWRKIIGINFLKLGVDIETVSKGTGIPIEKVTKLYNNYSRDRLFFLYFEYHRFDLWFRKAFSYE